MKIQSAQIVETITVPASEAREAYWKYEHMQRAGGLNPFLPSLRELSLPNAVRERLQSDARLPKFKACIVGYNAPKPIQGMDRRHALGVLQKLGLQAPSTAGTIQLLSHLVFKKCFEPLLETIQKNQGRHVVALTPFHPESPEYFYFGRRKAIDGSDLYEGTFGLKSYWRTLAKDTLYLHEQGYAHDQGNERYVELKNFSANFPLLLGIKNG